MGQRVRIVNAAQQAMAASRLGQNVIENIVEDQHEVAGGEEQDYVDGVEGEEDIEGLEEEGDVEGGEAEENNEGVEAEENNEGGEAEAGEEEEDAEAPFEYDIVTKTTTTGKKTHVIYVGDNKYLS